MDQSRTFVRNVASLTTANLAAHVVTAIVSLLVINHLGDVRYGTFKTALAFATVFLIFAETGVGMRFLYDRSGDKSKINEHFGAALVLQMLPYVLALGVTLVFARIFNYSALIVRLVAIVSVAAIFRIFAETCEKVINVYQQMHLTAILRSVRFTLIAIGGILLVTFDWGPTAWALITLLAMMVSAVSTFWVSLRFARPRLVPSMLWGTLAASYIFGAGAIFYAIYENVDQVMLSKMMAPDIAEATVGVYGAAYVLMMFTYTIPASFVASMEPVVFSARGDKPRLAHLGNLSSRALGVIALPLAAGTIILAGNVRALILPNIGVKAGPALAVLATFGLFRFFNFPAGMVMAAAGMQKRRVAVQAAATVLNISVNLMLIPYWGLFGAAWATVATELFIFLMYEGSLVRALPGYGEFQRFGKPVVATLLMAGFVLAGREAVEHWAPGSRFVWLPLVPLGALFYFAALRFLRFFTEEEKTFFAKMFGKFLFWRRNRE